MGNEGGVSEPVGGERSVPHFVEQATGELPLLGAEDVAQDDVVGEDGGGVVGVVVDPVEKSDGALPVGFFGEEGDHEADGELAGFVLGH